MRAIIIPVGGDPLAADLPDDKVYEAVSIAVGGLIERVDLGEGVSAWIHESGRYECLPNRGIPAVVRDLSALAALFGGNIINLTGAPLPAPGAPCEHQLYGPIVILGEDDDGEWRGLTEDEVATWTERARGWRELWKEES